MSLQQVFDEIDHTLDASLHRLCDFLRIQSISTDPAYRGECERAADWLVDELTSIGFSAGKRQTEGCPMVTGESSTTAPRILFYGHYDVQPVDPLDLWEQPPFEPRVETCPGGRVIRGRGASDDKGQLMTFVEACRAWKAVTGEVPENLRFLFEGEEECGSPSLVPFLQQNADRLSAETALICDTGLFDRNTPAIVTMLRGLLGEEVTVTGPDMDLHSGMYGGPAINPARVLARIISGLHDENNRITVPGFYDGIEELPAAVHRQWQGLDFDAADFLGQVGLSLPAGEKDRSALEMIWSRPTCEVNGLNSGYTGNGFKTVLPASASAKISFRLVLGQCPFTIRNSFRAYVKSMLPEDCSVAFADHGASPGCRFPTSHPICEAVQAALTEEWPNEAVFAGCGGSIPIAGHFKSILGIDSILTGFGNDDDCIHSPNEKYDVRSFRKGIRSWTRLLARLAG
ncbi:MAG: M20/M25/M40 family metallo-hydrolase [Rhodobacteraceae bacterium]|nr:M20/M25/M40 family metallo-hydrolase [Paracoccaceae bacterium]